MAKKENRGGKRPGSGRKPKYMLTEYQIQQMHKKAKKRAREEGKTIDDILLDIVYDSQALELETKTGKKSIKMVTETRDKLAAIKLWKEYTLQKHTEKDVNVNINHGPVIGLPEMRPDPAKQIPDEERIH